MLLEQDAPRTNHQFKSLFVVSSGSQSTLNAQPDTVDSHVSELESFFAFGGVEPMNLVMSRTVRNSIANTSGNRNGRAINMKQKTSRFNPIISPHSSRDRKQVTVSFRMSVRFLLIPMNRSDHTAFLKAVAEDGDVVPERSRANKFHAPFYLFHRAMAKRCVI